MTKQHLEGYLSRTLKELEKRKNYWYLKLQVMPLAYTNTPADFLVLTDEYRYLIECKETINNSFSFNRLTQEYELARFDFKNPRNHSYILLMFWKKRLKKSYIFLISIENFRKIKAIVDKKSVNLNDLLGFEEQKLVHRIKVEDNLLDIDLDFISRLA